MLPNSAAQKAGLEPGDVVVEFNGRPVSNRDELVKMVVATKPGTTVPVKILRNKQEKTLNITVEQLDLDAEQQSIQTRRNNNNDSDNSETQGSGFGVSLSNLTPQIARRLQLPAGRAGALISDVDPDGPAAQSGIKIVMTTHDLGQVRRLAGDVIFLLRGSVCERRPVGDFLDNPAMPETVAFLRGDLVI